MQAVRRSNEEAASKHGSGINGAHCLKLRMTQFAVQGGKVFAEETAGRKRSVAGQYLTGLFCIL